MPDIMLGSGISVIPIGCIWIWWFQKKGFKELLLVSIAGYEF